MSAGAGWATHGSRVRRLLTDPAEFSRVIFPHRRMRRYQREPARAIADAVIRRARGDASAPGDLAMVFSRQAGKDETLSQLLAYLLVLFQKAGGSIVVAAPTLRPQAVISRDRLLERLRSERCRALGVRATVQDGTVVRVGNARCHFLSAGPQSNARGATASLLLVANEAQEIEPDRWDAVFAPMAASTDAPTLMLGTVWTADTLLARQMRHCAALEATERVRRLFRVPWDVVAAELPTYGRYVARQRALLGESHPFILTEYELIELDGAGGLFPLSRQAQMQGEHPPEVRGERGAVYAALLDVAGEEEDVTCEPGRAYDPEARRDSTALTIVRVLRGGEDVGALQRAPTEGRPLYQVVRRYLWTGVKHTSLHAQLVDLLRNVWRVRYLVVDATGVGAGLASFLSASLGERVVLPFTFGLASKSALGWEFLGIVDSGRFKDYAPTLADPEADELHRVFWRQVRACTYEVRPGPNRLMSWGVPDPRTHDDLLISAALCAELDKQDWRAREAKGR